MCTRESCEWPVTPTARRCWRVRLIHYLPTPLLEYPFAVTMAIVASIYGPMAIAGQTRGAIVDFLPWPFEIIWGSLLTLGGVFVWAALARGRTGTWLPTGLWVVALTLLAYVAVVLFGLKIGSYQTRFTMSAVLGPMALVQAFKMHTGHLWAVAAIRESERMGRE